MSGGLSCEKVLITGASSGIGAAAAELIAAAGARVCLHSYSHRDQAETLAGKVRRAGGAATVLAADLTDREARSRLVADAVELMDGLDGLVNSAGSAFERCDVLDLNEETWEQTFALNVKAPFFLSQQAFPHMKSAGGGRIVNISSIGVKYGGSQTSLHYAASKSALETVTLGLSKVGAKDNVLVNAIRPGFIDTPFHEGMSSEDREQRVRMIPLGRAGRPIDVAQMVLYLLSESGDFITGQTFSVSGGD